MAFCPTCQRQFDEPDGFCPYDGSRLEAGTSPVPATDPGIDSGGVVRAVSARDSAPAVLAELVGGDPKAEYDRLLGTTLDDRYRIESKLGEGGMGVVFLGRHAVIEKPVAIKVLKREVARDQSTVKRFVQEAKAASRIGHPNIVDVTDFGTTPDGMTYSVMEFVEGRTLGRVIREEAPLELGRALIITAQIARALAAAHDKGIVHRDLKPENVFILDREGRRDFVKIVDFGIAKVTPLDGGDKRSRLTRAGTVFGTPEYMAPEQAAGRTDTDGRVDVYALGIILYELLVGKVPHKGESLVRTLAMQMLDPIIPPREARPELDLSDALEATMMKMLAKDRAERFQSMHEVLAALEDSAGVPIEAPAGGAAHRMLTGSRASPEARTLVPRLPPGIDPAAAAGTEAPPPAAPPLAEADLEPPRATPRHEPAFVARKRPLTLDLQMEEDGDGALDRRPRWPLVLGVLGLLVAGGAAAFVLTRGPSDPELAAALPLDAGVTAEAPLLTPADAGAEAPADATIAQAPADAAARTATREPRKPPHPTPAPTPTPTPPRKNLDVQIITKPEGATLYIDGNYSGSDGTTLTRPQGTRITITCRLRGHDPGKVEVHFDGVNDVYLCRPRRQGNCVKDLKNPFDDCPE